MERYIIIYYNTIKAVKIVWHEHKDCGFYIIQTCGGVLFFITQRKCSFSDDLFYNIREDVYYVGQRSNHAYPCENIYREQKKKQINK